MQNKKSSVGRPGDYEQKVKPRLSEIKKWSSEGATKEEIAKKLNIGKSTFMEYQKQFLELKDALKKGRAEAVDEIKAALFNRAIGFSYNETEIQTENIDLADNLKEALLDAGVKLKDIEAMEKPKLIKTKVQQKKALPDTTAGLILLQHWDKDPQGNAKWSRDPAGLEVKKKELKLKTKQVENNNW